MPERPNILLITADQMRWDCLHAAGNESIRTPNLDRIAARGVRFRNAFTPNPICVPARATIMTGNHSLLCTGTKNNGGRIREGQPLLTETLKRVGYRAYAMGKLHFVPYSPPGRPRLVHGFDHVDLTESGRILAEFDPKGSRSGLEDYADYLDTVGWGGYTRAHGIGNNDVRPCPSPLPPEHTVDHWIADCTMRQIERHRKECAERPFFLWMSSPKPHSPYDPPRGWDDLYDPRALPRPFGSPELLRERQCIVERTRHTHALTTLGPEAWQVIRSYYYGCITWLDHQIGRVLEHLEATGLLESTLLLFTADHGDLLGDFGSAFKCNHLNGSVRVPFLAAGPGVRRGAVSEALVGLEDILPTCAAAADADIGQPVHGADLGGVLADPGKAVRDTYDATTLESPFQSAMLTDGRMKYIYSEANGTEELYDQAEDPAEVRNLAGEPAHVGTVRLWRERLASRAREVGDDGLFEGDGFRRSEEDRKAYAELPVNGMGWRWY